MDASEKGATTVPANAAGSGNSSPRRAAPPFVPVRVASSGRPPPASRSPSAGWGQGVWV